MNILVNVVIYQAVWFLCVLGENRGAGLALLLLGLHLFLVHSVGHLPTGREYDLVRHISTGPLLPHLAPWP